MVQQTIAPPNIREQRFRMSFEEFLDWAPDEGQAEWVDGEGIAYGSTSTRHGEMVDFLAEVLRRFVTMFALGRVFSSQILLRLPNRRSGRMPDIFVVSQADLDLVQELFVDGAALFLVEFISDESEQRDLIDKRSEFESAGFPEYLAIDARTTESTFTFLRLAHDGHYRAVEPDDRGRYHSLALRGFWIDPAWFQGEKLPDVDDVLLEIAPEAYEAWVLAKIQARQRGVDR
jgi:Uma2 family endonuclease